MSYLFRIAVVAPLVLGATGCSKSETAQARGGESTAMRIKVEAVRRDSIPRAVDVVGTLAAVDQVTISSETDGKVSRILADLGDRVTAGQVAHSARQRETAVHLRAAAGCARPRPRAVRRGRSRSICRTSRRRRTRRRPTPSSCRPHRPSIGRASCSSGRCISQQALDDAQRDAAIEARRAITPRSRTPRTSRASIQASEATMKLADRELRDTEIRAPFDGFVEKRLVNLGELVKAQMPVMAVVRLDPLKVIAEIPEKMAPWIHTGLDG